MVKRRTLWGGALLLTTLGGHAETTLEELKQIIERQQRQIETLQKRLEQFEVRQQPAELEKRIEERISKRLEKRTSILAQELEKLRTMLFIPEKAKYKSVWGMGPAASKVYHLDKGLSIGGYGEGRYQIFTGDQGEQEDNVDFVRLVLYAGYKFTDWVLFNSEIEFEHGNTGKGGTVSVEFSYLDFLLNPKANIRAGMVLVPMGFINKVHEPPFFFGNHRPLIETVLIPTTWNEMGIGLFGELDFGINYEIYGISSLLGQNFSAEDGIRRARGRTSRAPAESLAFTGRIDYTPPFFRSLTVGASAFIGDTGHDRRSGGQRLDLFTQIYEGHVQLKYRGLHVRGLGAVALIDEAGALSRAKGESVGNKMTGWYAEVGYDIMPWLNGLLSSDKLMTQSLIPFFRYERWDTLADVPSGFKDNGFFDRRIWQVGIQYKPIPNVVIKADYRNFDSDDGELPDDFNLGIGFIF